MPTNKKLLGEMKKVAALVGKLQTRDDFREVLRYRLDFESGQEENFKALAVENYVGTKLKPDWQRIWSELMIFELFDEISTYLIPGHKLDGYGINKLTFIAKYFVNIHGQNALSQIDGYSDISIGTSATCVAKLKLYLESYRIKNDFVHWNIEHLLSVTRVLFRTMERLREKRPSNPRTENDTVRDDSPATRDAEQPQTYDDPSHNGDFAGGHLSVERTIESPGAPSWGDTDSLKLINTSSRETTPSSSPAPTTLSRKSPEPPASRHQQPETTKSEPDALDSPIEEISPEVQDRIILLEALVGDISTPKQVEQASKFLDDIKLGNAEDDIRADAWRIYTASEKIDHDRTWWYLDFWRLMKEFPSSVVKFDEVMERNLLSELNLLCQRWTALATDGGLGRIEQLKDVKAVKARGGTSAEVLAAYLEHYRQEEGFDTWTQSRMSDVRIKIIKMWRNHRPSPMSPTHSSIQPAPLNSSREKRLYSAEGLVYPYACILCRADIAQASETLPRKHARYSDYMNVRPSTNVNTSSRPQKREVIVLDDDDVDLYSAD